MARLQNRLQQAFAHHQAGKLSAAEPLYRRVLRQQPLNADALYLLGTLYFQRGQYAAAVRTLQRAVSVAPDDAGAHNNLGSALQKQGQLDDAVRNYERALALKPEYAEAHYNLGVTLQTRGQHEAAAIHFAQAVALDPASVKACYHLGVTQQALGHLEEAGSSYEQAVALQPDFAEAHNNLGMVLRAQGYGEAAIASYKRALSLDPTFAEAYNNLGNALKDEDRLNDAIASFEQALTCRPDYAEAHYNLAQVFTRQGKLEAALLSYEHALVINPNFAEAHYGLAHTFLLQDKLSKAAGQFRLTLELQPTHEEARFFLNAVTDAPNPKTVPPQVVVSMFDRYAEWFDTHLRHVLRYRIPEILRQTVEKVADEQLGGWTILDLGCGTGQCGTLFRDLAATLIGVDLSPRMLAKAAQRGVYDELRDDDLTTALRRMPGACDLVLAADVFIYVGALAPVFAACYTALREDGRFAFSVEVADEGDFVLRSSGRFAHTPAYITALAQQHGFIIEYEDEVAVRLEKGQPIAGQVFILRREAIPLGNVEPPAPG